MQRQYQYTIPEATNEEEKEQSDFNGMDVSIAERFARTNKYLNMEIAKEEEEFYEYDSEDDSYGEDEY